jgi:putative SOS response-associated peptidase YedK
MCGRVAQHREPVEYGSMLKIDWTKTLSRDLPNAPPHYNGAPGQDYLVARSHPEPALLPRPPRRDQERIARPSKRTGIIGA